MLVAGGGAKYSTLLDLIAANHRAAIVADAIQRMLPPYTARSISQETRIPETSASRIFERIKKVSHAKLDISYKAIGLGILVVRTNEKGYKGVRNNVVLAHWLKSAIVAIDRSYMLTFTFPIDKEMDNERVIIENIMYIDDKAEILGSFDEKVYAKPSLEYYRSRNALSPMQALHVQGSHPLTRLVSYDYNITRFASIRDLYKRNRREAYLYAMALGEKNALELTRKLSQYLAEKRGLSRGKKAKAMKYIDKITWAIRGSKLALLRGEAVSVAYVIKAPSDSCLREVVTSAMTYLYTSSLTINEKDRRMMAIIILPKIDNMILEGLDDLLQSGCAVVERSFVLRKKLAKLTIPVANFDIDKWIPLRISREKLEEIMKKKLRKYNLS